MTYEAPDDYRLQAVERTGYPDGGPAPIGRCCYCGADLYGMEQVYKRDGEIFGCDNCVTTRTADGVYG